MGKLRLGFDIGSSSLKIAVIERGKLGLEEVRLPENLVDETGAVARTHAFAQFLRQTRKDLALPKGPAALVLPPSQAICRLVTMPQMNTQQLMLNLPYEFADFIQGTADQYFCDYAMCEAPPEEESQPAEEEGQEGETPEEQAPEEEPTMTMMAAAAEKATLAEYAKMFRQAGLKLKVVLPQEMALIQLCQARGGEEEEFCFVDLGHQFTRITVVWRDQVQATRQIGLGGRNLDAAIATELGVDQFLSNTYKTTNFQDVQTLPAVAELCERIAVEILKVVNFYRFTYRSSALSGVYLVGGGAAMPLLREIVEDTVELPLLDPAALLPEIGEGAGAGVFAAGAVFGR